jgi:hypothetical protein
MPHLPMSSILLLAGFAILGVFLWRWSGNVEPNDDSLPQSPD